MSLRGVHRRSQQVALDTKLQWTLAILYVAILAYRLLRLLWAWRRTMQLLANIKDVNPPPAIREIVNRLEQEGSLGHALIQGSPEAASPFVTGIRQPMLVIPESLLQKSSEADLSLGLAHEFAHLKRRDFLLNLLYEIASILVAFHPITALNKQKIEDSRELACDEIAAEQTGSRSEYASSLLRMHSPLARSPYRDRRANLSAPMNLSDIRFDGKSAAVPVSRGGRHVARALAHRAELAGRGQLVLGGVPQGLKFKPIRLAKHAGNSKSAENDGGTRSTVASATQKAEYILGDLKIEGDVHDRDAVRDRVLKQLAGQEFDDIKDLVAAVAQRGARSDFPSRGYFKVAVQDPTSKPMGESGGKQQILVVVPVSEGAQYRLKNLTIASVPPEKSLNIPTPTLRDQFHLRPNDPFSVAEIRAGMERATKLYADRGYPEVQLQPETDIDEAGASD